jgi:hypothetical protein
MVEERPTRFRLQIAQVRPSSTRFVTVESVERSAPTLTKYTQSLPQLRYSKGAYRGLR